MSFIASAGSGGGKQVPGGTYVARCYSIIDMGTQTRTGSFGEKSNHEIRLGWELFGEDSDGQPLTVERDGKVMPMTITRTFTVSLHEKSNLRKFLAAWRGRDFTPEEAKAFDVSKLLGAYCMVNVTTSVGSNGKEYSNVASVSPLLSAFKNNKPAAVHPLQQFDLDAPDMAVFNSFYDKLKEQIKATPEWQKFMRNKGAAPVADVMEEEEESDVPFISASAAMDMESRFDRRIRRMKGL